MSRRTVAEAAERAKPGLDLPAPRWPSLFAPGWLLLLAPVWGVLLYQVGRGAGNTAYLLYWLAAATLLIRRREPLAAPRTLAVFIALLIWGGISAANSIAPQDAFGKWAQYALLGSAFFLTGIAARRPPDFSLDQALLRIGIIGLLAFAFYAGRFAILASQPNFQPELQVHGLVPAYLAPFALYFLRQRFPRRRGVLLVAAYLSCLLLLLIFSNSLTEVLALVAALVVIAGFRIRNKRALLLTLLGLFTVLGALILLFDQTGGILAQARHDGASGMALMDQLSSHRTALWRKALAMPPPDIWLGVGPGNVGRYPPVVIDALDGHRVGHLHNLLLDAWYEIGVVGLALYALFYALQLQALKAGASRRTPEQRAALWASLAAIAAASMIEQSYRSYHMAMFVPFLLALYGAQSLALRPPSTAST